VLLRLCLCLLAFAPLSMALADSHEAHAQGFLSDYGRLDPAGLPRKRYLMYTAPGAEGLAVSKVMLKPVTGFPVGVEFPDVEHSVTAESLTFLDRQLREALADDLSIVTDAAKADAVLEVAISGISAEEKGKRVIDFIPQRMVMNRIKDRVKGEALVGAVTLEFRVTNPKGEVLREGLRHLPGKGIGRAGDDDTAITFESLEKALKSGAEFIVDKTGPKI
jgi:hypothetical protein